MPAQHFSGRCIFDEDKTLWASWVILAGGLRVFFSGDTGFHDDFKTIGERYSPFDLTMHAWDEPFERICKLAQAKNVNLATPVMGERLWIGSPHVGGAWWLSAQN